MVKFVCDRCGKQAEKVVLHAKFKRGGGRLGGREVDLCESCSESVAVLILDHLNGGKGATAKARPRKLKSGPGASAPAA